jgi:hypothetical protein
MSWTAPMTAIAGSVFTAAASDSTSIGTATSSGARTGSVFLVTGLTPGTNIFTCRYRVGSGTGTYVDRRITVFPL